MGKCDLSSFIFCFSSTKINNWPTDHLGKELSILNKLHCKLLKRQKMFTIINVVWRQLPWKYLPWLLLSYNGFYCERKLQLFWNNKMDHSFWKAMSEKLNYNVVILCLWQVNYYCYWQKCPVTDMREIVAMVPREFHNEIHKINNITDWKINLKFIQSTPLSNDAHQYIKCMIESIDSKKKFFNLKKLKFKIKSTRSHRDLNSDRRIQSPEC